jgi:hypothetical protein
VEGRGGAERPDSDDCSPANDGRLHRLARARATPAPHLPLITASIRCRMLGDLAATVSRPSHRYRCCGGWPRAAAAAVVAGEANQRLEETYFQEVEGIRSVGRSARSPPTATTGGSRRPSDQHLELNIAPCRVWMNGRSDGQLRMAPAHTRIHRTADCRPPYASDVHCCGGCDARTRDTSAPRVRASAGADETAYIEDAVETVPRAKT